MRLVSTTRVGRFPRGVDRLCCAFALLCGVNNEEICAQPQKSLFFSFVLNRAVLPEGFTAGMVTRSKAAL